MSLSDPSTDSVGQQCCVMKVTGDNDPVDLIVYFAIRTTGPYGIGDGQLVRDGTGSVFTAQHPNISRVYALAIDLDPDTQHSWGAVLSTGDVVGATFNTDVLPTEETGGTSPAGKVTS